MALVDFGGRVVTDVGDDADPADARIRLGEDRLTVAMRSETLTIPLDTVFDVVVGPPPYAVADAFSSSTVTVAATEDDRREVVFVGGDEAPVDRFGQALYRAILSGAEVAVRHPTAIGGRITEARYGIGTLELGRRAVRFTDLETPFGFDVEAVVGFSERPTTLLGEERTVLELDYVRSGTVYGVELAIEPARKRHVLARFLRTEYDEIRSALESISLPEMPRRVLTRLYAHRGRASLRSVYTGSPDATVASLRGLERLDLVRPSDAGVELTPKGWILVTEAFDATNGPRATGA